MVTDHLDRTESRLSRLGVSPYGLESEKGTVPFSESSFRPNLNKFLYILNDRGFKKSYTFSVIVVL